LVGLGPAQCKKKRAAKTVGLPIGPPDSTRYNPNAWARSNPTYIIIIIITIIIIIIIIILVVVVIVVVFYYIIIIKY
jgi:heme/copper-type cytochrome/quinol oxidase subunit 2